MFSCSRCVRDGVSSPPTLAVVGDPTRDPRTGMPDLDPTNLGGMPVVFVRAVRRPVNRAKVDNVDNLQFADLEESFGADYGSTAYVALTRLLPRASNVRETGPLGATTSFRAPFQPLVDMNRHMIQCPRGHRFQVTRAMLVRRAEQARAEGDERPTI